MQFDPENIERFIEGQASLTRTEKERQFADGREGKGAGVEPNHTTA